MQKAPLVRAGRRVLTKPSFRESAPIEPLREEELRAAGTRAKPQSETVKHPAPRRGVYRSANTAVAHPPGPGISTGQLITVPLSAQLWRLLHLAKSQAVAQNEEGRYRGVRVRCDRAEFERHLSGEVAIAFAVLNYRRALFAVLDVDACFPQLLPAIRDIVAAVGGDELYDATFLTNGSDEGRGKVVFCFQEPVSSTDARKFIQHLRARVRATPHAGALQNEHLTAFPQEKSGGVVRILGRNPKRNGQLEQPCSLDGEVGVAHIRPFSKLALSEIASRLRPRLAPWAQRFVETPWRAGDGTNKHYDRMIALAREAIRVFGVKDGRTHFNNWLVTIKVNSPELALRSNKNRDPRNVIDRSEAACEIARRNPFSWEPRTFTAKGRRQRGVAALYLQLANYIRANGLNPSCFGIDYERIALLLKCAKSTAWRRLQAAEKLAVIAILDRGSSDTMKRKGEVTLIGLVCEGQTQDQVRAVGRKLERVRQRELSNPRSLYP